MADRDVKLIIRAKNDASRAIDSVADALKVLDDAQSKVSSSAKKSDDSISRLSDELAKMNARVAGMQAMTKLSGTLDRAAESLENLRGDVGNAAVSFRKYTAEAAEAEKRVWELEGATAALEARLSQEKTAREAARSATLKSSAAQKELTAAQREYNQALKVKPEVAGRDDGIARAKERLDAAKASVQSNRQAYEDLQRTYQQNREKLAALGAALREAGNDQRQFQSAAEGAAIALQRQQASLAKGESEYAQLDAMVQKAAVGFGTLEKEQSQLEATTSRLIPEVGRLGAVLAALQRYSGGASNFVDPRTAGKMRQLRVESEAVEKTWKTLEAEAARLAKEIRAVGKPTEQQASALKEVVSAAGAAKGEYRRLQVEIQSLNQANKASLPITDALIAADRQRADSIRKVAAASKEATAQQIADSKAAADAAAKAAADQAGVLKAARDRYSDGAGGFADPQAAASLRASNAAIAEAEGRLKALRAAYAQLNSATQLGKSATAQQKTELLGLRSAADLAERELIQLRTAVDAVGSAMHRARTAGSGMFGGINRDSRQAMSVFQRVRGEVLALATAYVGLYGTISNIGGVINAYQQLEAAQNRLGAVFSQDDSKVAQELGFIERQASRLGIEFGTLANQYSKFAISAQAANFSQEETRRVFLSVAEAGRVNKLSLEDMNGIFLALTQMIQKSRIGSEELRQQLGERLPGAVNIMADALGVTTAELSKMMEEGEVLADSTNLIKFADELDKRFGGQLADSLRSTTTAIGKFWNNIFQAQVQVANGGFIAGFNALLEEMNKWFESREGRDFFLALGAASGKFMGVLKVLAQNIEVIFDLIGGLVTLKVAAWFTGMANGAIAAAKNMSLVGASATGLATSQTVAAAATTRLQASLAGGAGAATVFGTSLLTAQGRAAAMSSVVLFGSTALTTFTTRAGLAAAGATAMGAASAAASGAIRLLGVVLTALGGPVGILITLATIIGGSMLVDWATGIDGATAALDEHQRIMGEVLTAYDEVKGKTDDWAAALKNVSLDEANANLRQMSNEFNRAREQAENLRNITTVEVGGAFGGFDSDVRSAVKDLQALGKAVADGKLTLGEYRQALEEMYRSTPSDSVREFLESQLESARAAEETADKYALAAEVAQGLGSALDLVGIGLSASTERLKDAAEASDETATSFDQLASNTSIVDEAINKLKENIPELAAEMKLLKEQTDINKTAWEGLVAAIQSGDFSKIGEIFGLWGQASKAAQDSAANFGSYGNGMDASSALIREFEGFRETPYWDVNAYRAGYGSDTVTLADGSIHKITEGMRVSVEDAERDLARRIGEFQNVVIGQVGGDRFSSFSADQQAVLTSIAYNYGELPGRIVEAVRSGSDETIASAIRGLGNDNGGINSGRRNREAAIFERAPDGDAAAATVADERERAADAEQRITEEKLKQQEATDKALADLGFDNEMLGQRLAGKEREVFIEEELRRLKEQNPNITAAEIEQATELLGKKYEMQKALTAEKDEKKQIREIEQQIADLETQRNEILAQRKIYEQQGDGEKMKQADAELAIINQKLLEAVALAQQMMAALGGEGADAAIAKMKTLGLEISNTNAAGQNFRMTAEEMSQNIFNNLESGIVSAFQTFAQAIANGENAVESLGMAFRQFAANFLMEIATMILKQTIFNALQTFSKAMGGNMFALTRHTGGAVTATGGSTREVSPMWFRNAVRYHTGGIAGLAPDEVPTILRQGEEVLTETDPRHRANGGGGGGKSTKVINMFDAASFLGAALAEKIGEEAVLNYVRANPAAFKAALG